MTDINVQNILKSVNITELQNNIRNLDVGQIIRESGFTEENVQDALNGNFDFLKDKKQHILDYEKLVNQHQKFISVNLINYFFKKAKLKEDFTPEELNVYNNAWTNWFKLVFETGKHLTFQIDPELNDITLILIKDEEYYQMSKFSGINQIIYLGDHII